MMLFKAGLLPCRCVLLWIKGDDFIMKRMFFGGCAVKYYVCAKKDGGTAGALTFTITETKGGLSRAMTFAPPRRGW